MKPLTLFINNEVVFEFDRETSFEDSQLAFLDKMDGDMARGIKIQGELVSSPDVEQRARFVVMNLIKALQQDNEAVIYASCAYLVQRNPALAEVHATDSDREILIEFINEQ